MAVLGKLGALRPPKAPFMAAIATSLSLVVGALTWYGGPVSAAGCPPDNDVLTNGFSSNANFINQVENGDSSGHTDTAALYAATGLDAADYGEFESSAVPGTAKMDGTIWVDDTQVASDGFSYGRTKACQGSDPQSLEAGGTTFWGNVNAKAFASDNLGVKVLFDKTGTAKFVVMTSCGNPIKVKPIKPVFSCDLLEKHPVDGKENTFTFTTQATATNNATIDHLEYDFGDGSPKVTTPNGETPTPPHTFTKTSTVTVTVFVNVPGKHQIPVTSEKCEKVITVTPPVTPPKPPVTPPVTPPTPPTPPKVLPNTGAGSVVGLFGVATTGGYFAYRRLLLRRRTDSAKH